MRFSLVLTAALSLPVLVNTQPQTGYPTGTPPPPAPTPSVPPSNSTHINVSAVFSMAPIVTNAPPQVQISPGLYTPSSFTASKGTTITFYFPVYELFQCLSSMLMHAICRSTELHSATQGSFDNPCVYLNDTRGAGFDSGAQSGTQFTIRITNDQERKQSPCHFFPLWCNDFTRQPFGFSARFRATVVSEWLG